MDEAPYKRNRNVFYVCQYHVVWFPKFRRKELIPPIEERLQQIIHEVCEELEVMPDHVHLLVSVETQFGIHRLMKGRSSRLLRMNFLC
jgi:putative transposase